MKSSPCGELENILYVDENERRIFSSSKVTLSGRFNARSHKMHVGSNDSTVPAGVCLGHFVISVFRIIYAILALILAARADQRGDNSVLQKTALSRGH